MHIYLKNSEVVKNLLNFTTVHNPILLHPFNKYYPVPVTDQALHYTKQ